MKCILILTLCALLLCGCGSTAPAPTPAPTAAPVPSDAPQTLPETMGDPIPTFLPTLWVEEGQRLDCDLDSDGTVETIEIESVQVNEYMEYRTLRVTGSAASISAGETMIASRARICLTDMDVDGVYEIFLSGDVASDDYITYGCHWNGSALVPLSFLLDNGSSSYQINGGVTDINTGTIWLFDHVFMLGTYGGWRDYYLDGSGQIIPMDTISHFRDNTYWLETATELPAVLEKADTTLPAGTKLRLTEADNVSTVWFELEDGRSGSLTLSESEDKWGWCINGLHELECFVELPYAG